VKLKKKLNEAQNTIDKAETRTRAIQRKLREVEASDNVQLLLFSKKSFQFGGIRCRLSRNVCTSALRP
jgi:hypothetical protein